MFAFLTDPWPWWVGGPLLGLVVPMLMFFGGKPFGISSSLRHMCAAFCPAGPEYFAYDWVEDGAWNLAFVVGIALGGAVAVVAFGGGGPIELSPATWSELADLGIAKQAGLAPVEVFSWDRLLTVPALVALVVGGFLLGFGARWGGGCTSGHGIMGLASFQLPSLIAVLGFFAGGLLITHLVMPVLFPGGGNA